jgi:hypothetical protein
VSLIVAVFSIAINARLSGRDDDASFEHLEAKNHLLEVFIRKSLTKLLQIMFDVGL